MTGTPEKAWTPRELLYACSGAELSLLEKEELSQWHVEPLTHSQRSAQTQVGGPRDSLCSTEYDLEVLNDSRASEMG